MTAEGAQFRRTIHDDAVWHSGSTTRRAFLSNMSFAYTLDTRMQQAPQRDGISLELHQLPGAGAWLVEGTNSSSLTEMGISFERLCNTASLSPSLPQTRSAPCADKFSTASATTQRSAHARETRTSDITWLHASSKQGSVSKAEAQGEAKRRSVIASCGTCETLRPTGRHRITNDSTLHLEQGITNKPIPSKDKR